MLSADTHSLWKIRMDRVISPVHASFCLCRHKGGGDLSAFQLVKGMYNVRPLAPHMQDMDVAGETSQGAGSIR